MDTIRQQHVLDLLWYSIYRYGRVDFVDYAETYDRMLNDGYALWHEFVEYTEE